jgi:hypothetical protein
MSDKPKCPVFGCTIPRGIPHEHAAGVSAVMRDPVAPLTRDERAELEDLRLLRAATGLEGWERTQSMSSTEVGTLIHDVLFQAEAFKKFSNEHPSYYVVPADAPMYCGRKLRDVLLMAGHKIIEDNESYILTSPPPHRRSLPSLIARFAFWIVMAMGAVALAFMAVVS